MHRTRSLPVRALALVTAVALTGCASTTVIRSSPSGATVYVENERVGVTPCEYSDRRSSFSRVKVRLEKEGYEPLTTLMHRTGSLNIAALWFAALIFPLFWMSGYPEQHHYVLQPAKDSDALDWEKDVGPEDSDALY
jgi:hypothetical protein